MKKITMNNIIFLTFKFGDLPWMDAPYTPHLSKNLHFDDFNDLKDDGKGLSLIVYLIDSDNGQIKVMRLLGMDNKFSRSLIKDISEISQKEFDQFTYHADLSQVYCKYSTNDLTKLADCYFKI